MLTSRQLNQKTYESTTQIKADLTGDHYQQILKVTKIKIISIKLAKPKRKFKISQQVFSTKTKLTCTNKQIFSFPMLPLLQVKIQTRKQWHRMQIVVTQRSNKNQTKMNSANSGVKYKLWIHIDKIPLIRLAVFICSMFIFSHWTTEWQNI